MSSLITVSTALVPGSPSEPLEAVRWVSIGTRDRSGLETDETTNTPVCAWRQRPKGPEGEVEFLSLETMA